MNDKEFQAWADFVIDSRSAEREAMEFVQDCEHRVAQQELLTSRSATKWC